MPRAVGPILRFRWNDPDTPATVSTALLDASDYMRDATPLLLAGQSAIITETEKRFATQTDPEGVKWRQWSKGYSHSGTILTRTGALREAVTDPASYTINENALFIEEDAMYTSYGAAHQFGEGKMPRRAFMGYSSDLVSNINLIFGRWVGNTVAIFERGGRGFIQFRDPLGRFRKGPVSRIF